MPTMVREAWTDERLDDLSKRMDEDFREVKSEIRSTRAELKAEIKSTRTELKDEIKEVKGDISDLKGEVVYIHQRMDAEFGRLNGRFDKLTYTLIAALIGLLVTHYLG